MHFYKKNSVEWNLDMSDVLKDTSIKLVIFDDFPGNVKDAHIYMDKGLHFGKIALTI